MFRKLSDDLTAEVLSFVERNDEPSPVEEPPRDAYERNLRKVQSRKRVGPYLWGRLVADYPFRLQDLLRVFATCKAARALFERDPRYKALCLCVAPHREHPELSEQVTQVSSPKSWGSAREVVRVAVGIRGDALLFCNDAFLDDKEIVLAALKRCREDDLYTSPFGDGLYAGPFERPLYTNVSHPLKNDSDVVWSALELANPQDDKLSMFPPLFRKDRAFALCAVQKGFSIGFFSQQISSDRDVIVAAVSQFHNIKSLQYALPNVRDDREVLQIALSHCVSLEPLSYASDRLRNDRQLIIDSLESRTNPDFDFYTLSLLPASFRGDRQLLMTFLAKFSRGGSLVLAAATPALQDDEDFVRACLGFSSSFCSIDSPLKYASRRLCEDRDVVSAAIQRDALALAFASAALKDDRELVLAAVSAHPLAFVYASSRLRDDQEVHAEEVQASYRLALRYEDPEFEDFSVYEAEKWYGRAAVAGHEGAVAALERLNPRSASGLGSDSGSDADSDDLPD